MCAKKTGSIGGLAVAGIDFGKDTFQLVGFALSCPDRRYFASLATERG